MLKRVPPERPGRLSMVYGILPGDAPDIVYRRGEGIPRCDAALLHYMLAGKRMRLLSGKEAEEKRSLFDFDKSFLEELEARGYDITTIRFSIDKRKPDEPRR